MDRRRERRDDRSRNNNGEDRQNEMRAPLIAPIEIVVHGQHLPRPEAAELRACSVGSPLVTGLYGFDRGFGFAPRFKNGVGCQRDVWRIGLRHPVNNGARLGQGIQDDVKAGPCLGGLTEAGIVQNHQEAEADQTSFHGRFPINCHNPGLATMFREQPQCDIQDALHPIPTGFRYRTTTFCLDKNAIDPQLLDLSSWEGSSQRTSRA
jgi:hypothetical protein